MNYFCESVVAIFKLLPYRCSVLCMANFHYTSCNTFRDMNYFLLFLVQYFWSSPDRQTDRQTESDA